MEPPAQAAAGDQIGPIATEHSAQTYQEELMLSHGRMLDELQQGATGGPVRESGVDSDLRALFHRVSEMELEGNLDRDCLGAAPFHALLVVFLAFRAKHAPPSKAAEAVRIRALHETLKAHTPSWLPRGYTVVGLCSASYAPVTLVRHGTTLYVAARATKKVKEYVLDSALWLKPVDGVAGITGGGRAHMGFLHAADQLVTPVLALIAKQRGVVNVYFCGHSLGGAVAQLLGLAYAQHQRRTVTAAVPHQGHVAGAAAAAAVATPPLYKSRVVTFGSPRVGDADLRNLLSIHTCHTRFFVAGDPVAGVPSPQTLDLWVFPSARAYAPHAAPINWRLDERTHAKTAQPCEPEVRVFIASVAERRRLHALTKYAAALDDHTWQCENRYWCTDAAAS